MTDAEKISLAVMFLKGSALSWWQGLVHSTVDACPFVTFQDFKSALTAAFQDPNFVERARHTLGKLRQTTSVRAYLDLFRSVCLRIPAEQMLDAEKKQRFVEGLKPYVRTQVMLRFPATFDDAAKLADQFDRAVYDANPSPLRHGRNGNYVPRPMTPSSTAPAPVPMEVDTLQTSSRNSQPPFRRSAGPPSRRNFRKNKPRLSDEQRASLMQNKGCFYCRKPNAGHLSYNCPERSRAN